MSPQLRTLLKSIVFSLSYGVINTKLLPAVSSILCLGSWHTNHPLGFAALVGVQLINAQAHSYIREPPPGLRPAAFSYDASVFFQSISNGTGHFKMLTHFSGNNSGLMVPVVRRPDIGGIRNRKMF